MEKAITDITIAFCETMKNAGYEVGVYSYSYWLNNYMEILRLPADYSLWEQTMEQIIMAKFQVIWINIQKLMIYGNLQTRHK